jgi:hypothetical protein
MPLLHPCAALNLHVVHRNLSSTCFGTVTLRGANAAPFSGTLTSMLTLTAVRTFQAPLLYHNMDGPSCSPCTHVFGVRQGYNDNNFFFQYHQLGYV